MIQKEEASSEDSPLVTPIAHLRANDIALVPPDRLRDFLEVPQEGLEPPRASAHHALNVARLPIPPLRLTQLL